VKRRAKEDEEILIRPGAPYGAFMAFPSTKISKRRTRRVRFVCQLNFRPKQIFIPRDIAGAVMVKSFKIAGAEQLAGTPIPGSFFDEFNSPKLLLPRARIGDEISISVANVTGKSLIFYAMLTGFASETRSRFQSPA